MKLQDNGSERWANSRAKEFAGYTGFVENWTAQLTQMIDEEHSTSQAYDPDGDFDLRNVNNMDARRTRLMKGHVDSGAISEDIKNMFTSKHGRGGAVTRWGEMATYLNENNILDTPLPNDEELQETAIAELAHRRKLAEDIYSRQTGWGKVGQIAGGIHGGILDPVSVVTAPLSLPMAGLANTSRALYAVQRAAYVAAPNMAAQIVIEIPIHQWKEEIGAEYTLQDSMFNVGFAGVLPAGVDLSVSGYKFLSAAVKDRKVIDNIVKEADNDLDKMIDAYDDAMPGVDREYAEAGARHDYEQVNNPDQTKSHLQRAEEIESRQIEMHEQGKETEDFEPDLDATDDAPMVTQSDEAGLADLEARSGDEPAGPEPEPFTTTDTASMKKADIIAELNAKHDKDLDTNPKKFTKEDLDSQLKEAEQLEYNRANKTPEQKATEKKATFIQHKLQEFKDAGRTMYRDGKEVPIDTQVNEDIELRDKVMESMTCMIS